MRKRLSIQLGVMIDCSRNAVMTVKSVKKLIDLLEYYGYNNLQLYLEDIYCVSGEPQFGYLRGAYTREEIEEMDTYARKKNIELIPCIQTLAHLASLKKWEEYREYFDCDDILLVDDARVYTLIDRMFASLAKAFSSRQINIGMDEAHMLGRGKHYDLYGNEDGFQVFVRHLKKVLEIAEKYGFECRMWSDMFFRLTSRGDYYGDGKISADLLAAVPKNVQLVYWDYDHMEEAEYRRMISRHRLFGQKLHFACGAWNWLSYAPLNSSAEKRILPAARVCAYEKVDSFTLTFWGDDGGECPVYASLPLIAEVAALIRGVPFDKNKFKTYCGVAYRDFMILDSLNLTDGVSLQNPSKYLLFDDCFCPKYNGCADMQAAKEYAKTASRLRQAEGGEAKEFFAYMAALADVLSIKSNLPNETFAAYQSGDKVKMKKLLLTYDSCIGFLHEFAEKYEKFWLKTYKPFGLEVHQQRFGGLLYRLRRCRDRIEAYIGGETDEIEELETLRLVLHDTPEKIRQNKIVREWKEICTVNVI